MDPILIPIIAVSIPILAVGGKIIDNVLKSQERRMEMRIQAQQGQNKEVTQELAALRAEIAALRDTSTQFDISVEHSVQRLEERLSRMEDKRTSVFPVNAEVEETQPLGRR